MMNVLHCIHSLSGGGAERQLGLLSRESKSHGMNPIVFCVDGRHAYPDFDSVTVIECECKNTRDPRIMLSLNRVFQQVQPDIVQAWLPASVTTPAMLIGMMHARPVVMSYRNEMRFHRMNSYAEYTAALFLCSGIISNTRVERSSPLFRWLYKVKSGVTIPNAVDLGVNSEHQNGTYFRSKARSSGNIKRLLYAGRLTSQKNWRCLVEAAGLIANRDDWQLDMYGDGEDGNQLRAFIEQASLEGRVNVFGFCPEILSEMQRSDLLIMPSLYEGMPNVLLEALAVGLPSLASDIQAVRDIVAGADCLVLFNPAAPSDLAEKLCKVLDHPEVLAEFSSRGRIVAERFSLGRMVSDYRSYYESVLRC